ncbi:hypothetical protein RKD37_001185 [Streptomyces ambofaciens]
MDRREIAALLAYIGRLDPRSIRTDEGEARDQLAQWHELLGDVPMAIPHGWDARVTARQHFRASPYQIQPADVVRPWESYRRNRLALHWDPTPSADPDDQAAWTAELVGTRRAVAAGMAQPAQGPRPSPAARKGSTRGCRLGWTRSAPAYRLPPEPPSHRSGRPGQHAKPPSRKGGPMP